MNTAIIRFGDGYAAVEFATSVIPESLTKKLTYWHRSFTNNYGKMIATGEYRQLYTVTGQIDPVTQQFTQRLVTMPGFTHRIKTCLVNEGFEIKLVDERTPMPTPDYVAAFEGLREYQCEPAAIAVASGGGILSCPTGYGKCTSPDTPVLYHDGTVKTMGDTKTGDLLMGDDSTPRTVLERIDGFGPMYRITPITGKPIEVADHHILHLVQSGTCRRDKYEDGHTVDITVADYLKRSNYFKSRHKLYKTGVEFPAREITIDPYFMGMWLGKGVGHLKGCQHFNLAANAGKDGKDGNILLNERRAYGLLKAKKKFIPRDFMINTREVRLKLLAGMLDSDGYYAPTGAFDWCSVDKEMAKDFAFLARSLGFLATESTAQVRGFGLIVTRYRVGLSGNLDTIPTIVKKKQATPRRQRKNHLRTGFSVEYIGDGPYVGVRLDGNMLHLLGDFTVFHNTHMMGAIVRAYKHDELAMRGTPLVVIAAPEKDITTKNYNDLRAMLPDREVGIVMSGKKNFSDDVQVITLDSLHLLDPADVGVLIVDEVHTASPSSRSETILKFTRAAKWGVSATPTGRFDGRDIVTEGLFGPVVCTRTYADGVACGALVPISVYWVACPEPHIGLQKYMNYKTRLGKYRHGVDRNASQNNLIMNLLERVPDTRQTLCIMPHVDQMNILVGLDKTKALKYVHAVSDQTKLTADQHRNLVPIKPKDRVEIYDAMSSGKTRKILSTYVYKQGVNFPQLEVIINAGGGGSDIVAAQIPGRESRNIEGKTEAVLIDFWHPWDTYTDKNGKKKLGPIHGDDRSREKVYDELGFKQYWVTSIDELPVLKAEKEMPNVGQT